MHTCTCTFRFTDALTPVNPVICLVEIVLQTKYKSYYSQSTSDWRSEGPGIPSWTGLEMTSHNRKKNTGSPPYLVINTPLYSYALLSEIQNVILPEEQYNHTSMYIHCTYICINLRHSQYLTYKPAHSFQFSWSGSCLKP